MPAFKSCVQAGFILMTKIQIFRSIILSMETYCTLSFILVINPVVSNMYIRDNLVDFIDRYLCFLSFDFTGTFAFNACPLKYPVDK